MLKKTITYEDFNGEEVSEDFFFHLSKAELVELEMSHRDGLSAAMERIIKAKDNAQLIKEFKNIVLSAYGKRSEDGRQFIKTQEIRDEFVSTEAYSVLFMELVTDTDAAIAFVQGVMPKGLEEDTEKVLERQQALVAVQDLEAKQAPEPHKEPEVISRDLIVEMSTDELRVLGIRLQSGEAVLGE